MVPKYGKLRYDRLDTLNIRIHPLIEENKCNNSGMEEQRNTVDTMSVLLKSNVVNMYSIALYHCVIYTV